MTLNLNRVQDIKIVEKEIKEEKGIRINSNRISDDQNICGEYKVTTPQRRGKIATSYEDSNSYNT